MTARHTAIAAILLLALTAVPSAAQTTFHFSGGLNRANVSNGPPDWVMRGVAGAALSFPVSGRLNLQLGADYSQKGFGATIAGASFSANLAYLEASALLEVAVAGGEGASLHLLAGPTFGLNMSCELAFTVPGLPGGGAVDCDDPSVSGDRPSGSDGGVVGGLRAGVGISDSMDLTIGAFYNFGVLNIFQGSGGNGKNRAMTVRAGFAYRIG